MPAYRKPTEVAWTATKYDDCTLQVTGHPYRHQKGSGRAEALQHIQDGMTVKQLTEVCAQHGFDSGFVVGSILKQMGAKDNAYNIIPPEGKTMADLKAIRAVRQMSEEQRAEMEARKAAKAAEKEAKAAERAKAAEEKAAAKAAAKAEAEAAKAAAKEAKAAEAAAAGGAATEDAAGSNKPKGKGKGKAKAPTSEQPAETGDAAAA